MQTTGHRRLPRTTERLVPDATKEAVGFEKLSAILLALQQLVAIPGTIMRFHPSRPMEETMGGKNLTFCLQLCVLGDSAKQVREHLAVLTGLSATPGPASPTPPNSRPRSSWTENSKVAAALWGLSVRAALLSHYERSGF